ncbi:MAG: peptidase U32 family protein [bacterium]|jgi:putative protease
MGTKGYRKPELLAPAGNLEKLQFAVRYGADAVYFGGEAYGLRAFADNFTPAEMSEGINFAHARGVKAYATVNIFARNADISGLPAYLERLEAAGVDGIILSDPGIFSLVRRVLPTMDIHISTQANTTNWAAVRFWAELGAKRVILAREMSLADIAETRQKTEIELEAFVHGAMCLSYSGRCYLSHYLTGRDANQGYCAQACRWKYSLVEEKRPDLHFPVAEDERGAYILNAKDLCMIEHIPELAAAGLDCLKIEGRMKSVNYVATVTRVYRQAIDAYWANPDAYRFDPVWREELHKASHREFSTGFYFGPISDGQVTDSTAYVREYDFVGVVREYRSDPKIAVVEQRNKLSIGDTVEFFGPATTPFQQTITMMRDEDGAALTAARHPQMTVLLPVIRPVRPFDLLRRAKTGAVE